MTDSSATSGLGRTVLLASRTLPTCPREVAFCAVEPALPPSERRRRPRALAEFSVTLHRMAAPLATTAKDVSELGIAVRSKTRLPMREPVEIELALPDTQGLPIIRGHVVRCMPVDLTGREHYIAISFTDVPPKTRAAIFTFVKRGEPAS